LNAIEIIEQVRAHDADLVLDGEQLVVRGRGKRLPTELQESVRRHKAELLVALGASREVGVLEVLAEIRPHLPPALRSLPNPSLLALVNWSILHAWNRTLENLRSGKDSSEGIQQSAASDSEQGHLFGGAK
jgi:hypothetical protein